MKIWYGFIRLKILKLRLHLRVLRMSWIGWTYHWRIVEVNVMMGHQIWLALRLATRIKEIEPRALLTHCYGCALQLAVCDTIKAIKLMRDILDAAFEVNKFIKYSPKRERAFKRLRKKTAPENSGYRILCLTRWTVRAVSLQSILDNWDVFQEL